MRHRFRVRTLIVPRVMAGGAAVVLLAACAATQPDTAALDDARALYSTASQTAGIFDYAASSMRQAQHHLRVAEQLLADHAPKDEIDHHSFLSRQHVAIAQARVRRGQAQEDIERGEQRRRTLIAAAERREATAAARRAEAAEDELTDTLMQLRMAERRAKALAERLLELGVTSSREPE
jgi:hypothetical protein